jgi:hypothetical protein
MKRMPFLLVLRFRIWRRYFHVVVTVSRAWEQPAGCPLRPAGHLRNIGTNATSVHGRAIETKDCGSAGAASLQAAARSAFCAAEENMKA